MGRRGRSKVGPGTYGGQNKRQTHSKRTGVKFDFQNPAVRKHGPKSRRMVYAEAIEKALLFTEDEGWVPSAYLADIANSHISKFWTALNGHSVGAIMREYEKKGHVISRKTQAYKEWKLIKHF